MKRRQALLRLRAALRRPIRSDIAHVVNPFACPQDHPSYLYYAQPITWESMRRARARAVAHGQEVELCAAFFEQDRSVFPDGFTRLPPLERSTASDYPELTDKSLPFVADMVERLYWHSRAELLVLTNADIGLYEDFYRLCALIHSAGHDAFVITRRNALPKQIDGRRLGPGDLDLIYRERGRPHPGFDCFVFQRGLWPKLDLGDLFQGFPPWGTVMTRELQRKARRFRVFDDVLGTFHLGDDASWKDDRDHPLWRQNRREARRLGHDLG